jgi:bifunctional UDP-N-acetylglucosamine pyrophosphorylase/glucosamine-1-phosphate N-acetyltransferase
LRKALSHHEQVTIAVQTEPKGTAHAVLAAKSALEGFEGTGLILLGDAPCLSGASLRTLLEQHSERGAQLSLLSGRVADPTGYGRVVRGVDGELAKIVEEKDADETVRSLDEINSGIFALELPVSWEVLEKIQPSAKTGELYVTEAIELTKIAGARAQAVIAASTGEVLGVNDRRQLAQVTGILRERINAEHMRAGVTLVDPSSAFIDARAILERDVRLEPFVVIGGPCVIKSGAVLGPFAHVRGGSTVDTGSRVGNFVEVVRTTLGKDCKALHLSYLGDGVVGDGANLGAGTVFANWDGSQHHKTTIGAHASIGANTTIVAPAEIGEGAKTGAGAVIVKTQVPAGATFVGVPAQGVPSKTSGGEA